MVRVAMAYAVGHSGGDEGVAQLRDVDIRIDVAQAPLPALPDAPVHERDQEARIEADRKEGIDPANARIDTHGQSAGRRVIKGGWEGRRGSM